MVPPPRLLVAVALLSAAALGTEVVLLRLFAIVQWPHVASSIVSLALLGYGVSGTVLVLTRDWAERRFTLLFTGNTVLFAVTALAAPPIAQHIPFNPLALFWESKQILLLAGSYALAALPFLFAASAIGLALQEHRRLPQAVYAADLFGAGFGAVVSLAMLTIFPPNGAIRLLAAIGFLAAAVAVPGWRGRTPLVGLAIIALFLPGGWMALHISPYKPLSQALTTADARVVATSTGPLGMVSVVESPTVPFRYAPGLSITSPHGPPLQRGLFIDGERVGAVDRQGDGNTGGNAYLEYLISALPYTLLDTPSVLVLGCGDGRTVIQAQHSGARTVEVVEQNRNLINLLTGPLASWSGNPFDDPRVRTYVAEPRAFVEAAGRRWDLIQVTPEVDGGGIGLSETSVLTVEGLITLLSRTSVKGVVAVTRPIHLPPRSMPKLLAMAAIALRALNQNEPTRHLIAIRGWQSSTVIIKANPFTLEEVSAARSFAASRAFDLVWVPGMERSDANRINILRAPQFYDAARALLGPTAADYVAGAKYHLAPATDDRPYFGDFFRWRLLPELFAKRDRGGIGLMEWGIPLLAATLLQAVVLSPILILLPLVLARRLRTRAAPRPGRWRILVFFLSLGLGFMAIEIAFVQRYVLLLGHPVYATAMTLSGFLVFAGLGSLTSERWSQRLGNSDRVLHTAALAVIALIGLNIVAFPSLYTATSAWPFVAKAVLGLGLIAPLAFAMGQFFPLGLAAVGRAAPQLVPWAWAINGCASVLGVLLATLTTAHAGFTAVLLSGAVLYIIAARCNPRVLKAFR